MLLLHAAGYHKTTYKCDIMYIHLRELMMNRLINNFEETKQIFISKSQSGWALTVDSQWHLSVEGDIRDIDHQY